LHAPQGALSWDWGNGIQALMISTDTTGRYVLNATFPVGADNLVSNGDFSSGATAFTSDLVPGTGGTWGLLSFEGTYAVTTLGNLAHTNFAPCTDHSGTGEMLVVNGSAQAGANIWCQTVAVEPNTDYAFSAWVTSMVSDAPAIMNFSVNGTDLGDPLLASFITCQWDEFYAVWNSGTATSATICINNQNLEQSGNDFALDDISFAPLCSWSDTMNVVILPPAPEVDLGPDSVLCPGSTALLTATLVPAGWPLPVTYDWSTGAATPSVTITEPGLYDVSVEGRCMDQQAMVFYDLDTCGSDLDMPNVFTPNGDGVNDTFRPILVGTPDRFAMEVRNRWGQVVFTTSSALSGWSGRVDGGPVPAGTYFWTVEYSLRTPSGGTEQHSDSGHVTLLDAR
jgi:gliding motility-associated-like protein